MSITKRWITFYVAPFLLFHGVFFACMADDDDFINHSERRGKSKYLPPVDNLTYREECGACHFAFQPGLLPSGSWEKILAALDNHNGESLNLSPESKQIVSEYLKANAAEHSPAKRSIKIMKSLNGQTPLRITKTPYILKKHDDISPDVLKRESIGTQSNCPACHTTAKDGIYKEKYVVIPD